MSYPENSKRLQKVISKIAIETAREALSHVPGIPFATRLWNAAVECEDDTRTTTRKASPDGRKPEKYAPKELPNLIRAAWRYAGHAGGSERIVELGLDTSATIHRLKMYVLDNLTVDPSPNSANMALPVMAHLRFLSEPGLDFFDQLIEIARKRLPEFLPIYLQRKADLEIRIVGDRPGSMSPEQMIERYEEAEALLLWSGDTHGYSDCLYRRGSAEVDRGDLDSAEKILLAANRILSSDYRVNPILLRGPTDGYGDKMGNYLRACAKLHIRKGQHAAGKTREIHLDRAEEALRSALEHYRGIRLTHGIAQTHGIANVYRERGFLERARGNLRYANYHEANLWFRAASRLFEATGDHFMADECLEIVLRSSESFVLHE